MPLGSKSNAQLKKDLSRHYLDHTMRNGSFPDGKSSPGPLKELMGIWLLKAHRFVKLSTTSIYFNDQRFKFNTGTLRRS